MTERIRGRNESRWTRRATAILSLLSSTTPIAALSTSSSNQNSPWKAASWKLILNIGREQGSDNNLPEKSWGASGARLSFPIELNVESDPLPEEQQDALLGGRGANRLNIIINDGKDPSGSGTYITEEGQQQVPIQSVGGWKLRLGRKKGHASLLQFWLDLGSDTGSSNDIIAQKKDVTLRAKERLYFAAHCWRETDYAIGKRNLQPILRAYEIAQAKLEEQVNHDSGDRRLDGTDALETLSAYKDMAGMTLDRDEKWRQLQEAQEYLPPPEELPLGNWPGDTEFIAIKPMELFVRKPKGLFGAQEEFHLIGTWEARPLNVVAGDDDDEYESYDDEEDDGEEWKYYDDDEGEEAIEEAANSKIDLTFENDGPIDRPAL